MAQTARTASQSWGLRVTAAGQSVIADGSGPILRSSAALSWCCRRQRRLSVT